jgi:hypothetical protein
MIWAQAEFHRRIGNRVLSDFVDVADQKSLVRRAKRILHLLRRDGKIGLGWPIVGRGREVHGGTVGLHWESRAWTLGDLSHVALVTGLKHYLGPFEAYAVTKPDTPFREDQPRLPYENFYYVQEDILFETADRVGFTWSVHRPHTVIGHAIGNLMNMGVTLAVYGTICRETGRPFVFPGSPEQYEAATDVTDSRILARHLEWAATNPAAHNQALNIVNGDVFRWRRMWGVLADGLGVEPAPYPGHASA